MPSAGRSASSVLSRLLPLVLVTAVTGLGALVPRTPAAAAPSPRTVAPDQAERWDWPVEGPFGLPLVLRGFDPPDQRWLSGHRGVDLAAEAGAVVVAAGSGTVVFAGSLAGRGVISIDHDGGLRTTYEPVDPGVVAGEPVGRGEAIGELEPLTAHCARTCLHWGLRRGADYLDPLSLVRPRPPVLLPYGRPVLLPPPTLVPWSWWPG